MRYLRNTGFGFQNIDEIEQFRRKGFQLMAIFNTKFQGKPSSFEGNWCDVSIPKNRPQKWQMEWFIFEKRLDLGIVQLNAFNFIFIKKEGQTGI